MKIFIFFIFPLRVNIDILHSNVFDIVNALQCLCHIGNVLGSEIFVPKEFSDYIMYSSLILSSDSDFSYNYMGGFVVSVLYFSFSFS